MESQYRSESRTDSALSVTSEYAPPWREAGFWSGTQVPLTRATGLQPAAYTSADFFADEQTNVFERAWVCVGLAAHAEAGRVLVRQVGGLSLIHI